MNTPILGRCGNSSRLLRIAQSANNFSICILGQSGSGKSTAAQTIAKRLVDEGGDVVALDYHGSLANLKPCAWINRIQVRAEGLPLTMLRPLKRMDGTVEETQDVAENVVEIFSAIAPLGSRQRRALRDAVTNVMRKQKGLSNELGAIKGALLQDCPCKESIDVFEKFSGLLSLVKMRQSKEAWKKGMMTILDLSGYSTNVQEQIAELILALFWRYCQVSGLYTRQPVYLLCDEMQVLQHRPNSVLTQILREGRKYNLALILATQTLATFTIEERAVIRQAATFLYFRPVASEVQAIVKAMDTEKPEALQKMLLGLRRGECVAYGRFEMSNGCVIERPLKMVFDCSLCGGGEENGNETEINSFRRISN